MNFIETKETIYNILLTKAAQAANGAELPPFAVEIPADDTHGDFSANAAMVFARVFRKSPRDVATLLLDGADFSAVGVEKTEVAGAGFINFYMNSEWYNQQVNAVLLQGEDFGRTALGEGKRVLVEFVSANPTGPMHIGNARGGALGDTLASLLDFAGYSVQREFYVNDGGNQIEKFAVSLNARYLQQTGKDVEMPEDSYLGTDITEHVVNFIKENGDTLSLLTEEERKAALVAYALPKNLATLETDLKRYRIAYDRWFKESEVFDSGAVQKIIDLLKERGATYESDGALWFKAAEYGAEKDIVLVRANGFPTYIVPDIAYHFDKLVTRGFDLAIDVLGADHHGYVPRMNAALDALGIGHDKLHAVIMQMVSLVTLENGVKTPVKLSKRSGKAITLATLLDEVPLDAARFFFNLRNADTHLEFDLGLAVEESSKNPVYYVQYAHARICRILEKNGKAKTAERLFTEPAELSLIRKLAAFPLQINESARELNPSGLTRYAGEVAAAFHKFYDSCRIIGADEPVFSSRLALAEATAVVLRCTLKLLKVTAPERM
ncbi:MAG: arginine--tRNA ligase [Oscillospiraceae bacterium]|nr:arginine--tRNA ligase [Oscillospiraceae bacterium]